MYESLTLNQLIIMENQNNLSRPYPRDTIIINPYVKNSNESVLKPIPKLELKLVSESKPETGKVMTLPNLLIRSDGFLGNKYGDPTMDSIHVYIIKADIAALQVQIDAYSPIKSEGSENTDKSDYFAMGFYDKSLKEIYLDKDEKSRASMAYRTPYLMWHFGSIRRKEMDSRKDWIVVPREIFKDIDDYVYLCICTEKRQGEPDVKITSFPKDQPFFYDLPVATSIHIGQSINDSKILLGQVMEFEKGKYIPIIGEYKWNDDENYRLNPYEQIVEKIVRHCYRFECSDDNRVLYSDWGIEIFLYKQIPEERAKDITAFVWQSGNEDDEVKKSYIKEGLGEPYNTYSYVIDSLSSKTIYGSMVSLTKLTPENAARYAVRYLANQPERFRCFSIDSNNLVYLMGGAIYKIEYIITRSIDKEGKLKNIDYDEFIKDNDLVSFVEDLFAVNGSHLFFDTNVTYRNEPKENVKYYMQDVLGIEDGSNGCKKIKTLLTDFFKQITKQGIDLNYVYCDIEGPWNDARALTSRRFSEKYFKMKFPHLINSIDSTALEESESSEESPILKERKKFYNTTILPELEEREEIFEEMRKRGFDFSTKDLSDVCSANNNPLHRHSFYGINSDTYPLRRNINIWDAVMKGYENELFYTYVMSPVLKYNPKAKCSVYEHDNAKGYVNHARLFETYLGGSVHQEPVIYSSGAIYGENPGEYYKKLCMDNWKMFPNKQNYFSYFVGNINKLRSLLVSTQSEEQRNGRFNAFFSSFNIWVNGYLQGITEEETKQLANKINNKGDDTIPSLEAYYNEFMYHLFLCCPDKAIAYFQVEKKNILEKGTTEKGGTYYFPFGDVHEVSSYQYYYIDCYRRLQTVLVELNNKIGKNEYETMVNTLASENEPYVISSIKLENKVLWRVTLNEPIAKQGETKGYTITMGFWQPGISGLKPLGNQLEALTPINSRVGRITKSLYLVINLSNGRKIRFPNVKNFVEGEYGLWIETPLDVEPKFTAISKYYENNPAYYSKIDYAGLKDEEMTSDDYKEKMKDIKNTAFHQKEFANVDKDLRYIHPATHTVFGESPQFITSSLKFTLNKITDSYVLPFYDGFELFFPAIGKLGNSADGLSFSTWYKKIVEKVKKIAVFLKKTQLIVGESYELIKYVALDTEVCAETRSGRIRLELRKLEPNGDKSLVFEDERDFSYDNLNQKQSYQSDFIDIAQHNLELCRWNDITIHDFKVYFTQQHEKLELFRESDGVNIGRVNKKVKAYANLPVETKWSDKLLGKFSWLNATDASVEYTITFKMFNSCENFQKQTKVNVNANSEGNIIIPLPTLDKLTRQVELTCEKRVELQKPLGTSFFVNYYNKNCKKTISVDISD